MANEFNSYFVSVGPTLAAHQIITDLNPLHYVHNNPNCMVLLHIEVVNVINSLNNSSPGWDGIPSRLTKRVLNSYIRPLTLLINQSFLHGIFPDELKLTKVIPIYKSGSTMELSNYRRIFVLNFLLRYLKDLCITNSGYKTGARYSQNASVKGSGRVPKSVHSPVISSTKKRSDIGVACTTIYL